MLRQLKAPGKLEMCQKPYERLYVYQVEGVVSPGLEQGLGPFFLGNWVEDNCSFLFFSRPAMDAITTLLERESSLNLVDTHEFTYEAWHGGGLEPFEAGPFLVVPSWHGGGLESQKIVIYLDPGVVFGSGLHPTTRDCLRALGWILERADLRGVLDLGTGTGILAVAAALAGAGRVLAVDLNPLCVRTAKENVRLNSVAPLVDVREGDALDYAAEEASLVMANLHYEVIRSLLEMEGFLQRAWVILSGLLRSQWQEVKARLLDAGLNIFKEWDHDMTWFTIITGMGEK